MRMVLAERKVEMRPCAACGCETRHEKEGTNHGLHFSFSFVSAMLWSPVWIVMAVMEAFRPFRCTACAGREVPAPAGVELSFTPKAAEGQRRAS